MKIISKSLFTPTHQVVLINGYKDDIGYCIDQIADVFNVRVNLALGYGEDEDKRDEAFMAYNNTDADKFIDTCIELISE